MTMTMCRKMRGRETNSGAPWGAYDEAFLRGNRERMSCAEIGAQLGRTAQAVAIKAWKLGLRLPADARRSHLREGLRRYYAANRRREAWGLPKVGHPLGSYTAACRCFRYRMRLRGYVCGAWNGAETRNVIWYGAETDRNLELEARAVERYGLAVRDMGEWR